MVYVDVLIREELKYNQLYSQLIHLQTEYEKLLNQILQFSRVVPQETRQTRAGVATLPIKPSAYTKWETLKAELEAKDATEKRKGSGDDQLEHQRVGPLGEAAETSNSNRT